MGQFDLTEVFGGPNNCPRMIRLGDSDTLLVAYVHFPGKTDTGLRERPRETSSPMRLHRTHIAYIHALPFGHAFRLAILWRVFGCHTTVN